MNLQTGYLFKNNLQIIGRYTSISLNEKITGAEIEDQYILGFSICRAQAEDPNRSKSE